jgi:segregation and condensation protein B
MTSENQMDREEDQGTPEQPVSQAEPEVPGSTEEAAPEAVESAEVNRHAVQEGDESPVCHSCEGRNPEDHQPDAEPGLREDAMSESDPAPATALSQDSQASSDGPPRTQGERDVDRVIGILLGEPQESAQEAGDQTPESEVAGQAQEPPGEVQPQAQEPEPQPELVPTVESVLEAILFATDEPLTDSKLAGIVETTTKQVRDSIESLNAKYVAENHAFRIEQIAGGYQMLTLNTYNSWLKKMLRARSDNKLSPAAMETLAIIAYKQPIIRADIEAIRGVAVGEVVRSLMYKSLVKIAGRAEILGRPMLYGTTKKFLEIFGLNSLKDLPKAEELKNPDRG